MTNFDLAGKSIVVITTNYGTEQDELTHPINALRAEGAHVTIAAQRKEPVHTLRSDKDPGEVINPETTIKAVKSADYDLLVIPGGTVNSDILRLDESAQQLVTSFAEAGKPIAAICHGPWLLVETGVLKGRTMTSVAMVRTDVINAGAEWIDQAVVVDIDGPFRLITSRNPNDLEDFATEIKRTLASLY